MAPLPQAGQESLAPLKSESSTERSPVDRASRRRTTALLGTDLSCMLIPYRSSAILPNRIAVRGLMPRFVLLAAPTTPPFPWSLRLPPLSLDAAAGRFDANHAALAQELETERPGRWNGLDQAHLDGIAKLEGRAGFLADQGLALLIMVEIFMADGGGRDEAVGAGLIQPHEEPGT